MVHDGVSVRLSVLVGPGQPSGVVARLAEQEVASGHQLTDVDLGMGSTLRGQTLLVDAVVRNDNPHTDRVAARLRLRGGEEPGDWPLRADLDAESLGRFSFTITFV